MKFKVEVEMDNDEGFRAAMTNARDPQTRDEWQEAVDCAFGLIALDSAKQYGLITGGPTVSMDLCEDMLKRGAERGIRPRSDAIEQLARAIAGRVMEGE